MSDDPQNPSRWLKFYRRHHKWFHASDSVLQKVFQARGGGWLSKFLVGLSVGKTLMDTAFPAEGPWTILRALGYYSNESDPIGGFLCDYLLHSELECQAIAMNSYSVAYYWPEADVAAIYGHGNAFVDGPFLKPGGEENFTQVLQDLMWKNSNELMIVKKKGAQNQGQGSGKFSLIPMHPLGRYIGKRQPKWYADRIRRYDPSMARTLCFRGPTGVGKSVLARQVARELRGKNARVLKVSSEVLHKCRPDELLGFVRRLQPTVLLLDDLALDNQENTESFLAALEILRTPGCLVIVTMMTSPGACEKEPKPGSWHFPGMRPGRIDEIFTLKLPNQKERAEILGLYNDSLDMDLPSKLIKQIAKRTEGLTGAYLMNVMERVQVHGRDFWKEEVDHVLYAAPIPKEEEEEEEKEGTDTPSAEKLSG